MKLDRLFLGANILLILISVAAHEIAAEEHLFLAGMLPFCLVVYGLSLAGRAPAIGDRWATVLCALAFVVMLARGLSPAQSAGMHLLDVRVPRVGEFLIVFQAVYLLRRRVTRDYFWMYLVTVVHMGTAGLLMPGFGYAFFFLAYATAAVVAVALYHVWHQVERARLNPAEVRVPLPALLAAAPVTLALVLVLAGVFVILPRRATPSPIGPQLVSLHLQPVAGFSPTVELGHAGTLQPNPQRVMRVACRGKDAGRPLPFSVLLHGASMEVYRKDPAKGWVWERGPAHMQNYLRLSYGGTADVTRLYPRTFPDFDAPDARTVELEISREPLTTSLLFAPWAPISLTTPPGRAVSGNRLSHMLACTNPPRNGPMSYSVFARDLPPPSAASRPASPQPPPEYLAPHLDLPADLSPRIRALAQTLCPPRTVRTDAARAERIADYLTDSSLFRYSLTWTPTPGVEPVEDFLFNRREGSCEYFAAAMVLLLRGAGVPARLVNGYRMEEWNELGGYYIVRQNDAHAWAEAYLRPFGWRVYDPTAARAVGLNRPPAARRWWNMLYDTGESFWVNRVLNYTPEDQADLYKGVARAADTVQSLWLYAMVLAGGQSLSLSPGQFARVFDTLKEPVGRVAEWAIALAGVGIGVWLVVWLMVLAFRWLRRGPSDYYRKMERLLARRGRIRARAETPLEFQRRLAGDGWPQMEPVARITAALCRERYAERPLTAEDRRDIESALAQLRRPPRA